MSAHTDEKSPKFASLSSSNYSQWSGEMKAWLMKMGYWCIVSAKELKPVEASAALAWQIKAEKAAGEIYLAVENDQRVHFKSCEEDPVQMWKNLEKAHLHKRPGARFNAYDEFFSIRKEDDETLTNLAMRIEKSMQQIHNLRPSTFTLETLDDELQCMAMIRALPEEYSHFSSSLLLMEKLDKDLILQAFKAEELNRQHRAEIVEEKAAKVTRGDNSYRRFPRKPGHYVLEL